MKNKINILIFGTQNDLYEIQQIINNENYHYDVYEQSKFCEVEKSKYNVVIVHIQHKDIENFIKYEIECFDNCPSPVIVLVDKFDTNKLRRLYNTKNIDFAFVYDFTQDVVKELLIDIINTTLEKNKHRGN